MSVSGMGGGAHPVQPHGVQQLAALGSVRHPAPPPARDAGVLPRRPAGTIPGGKGGTGLDQGNIRIMMGPRVSSCIALPVVDS